ncbi:uncharacterized protein UV8b_06795 [Ustilaginoidea virens]|uniref:Uncharacterized protein n=1 Tax=Ustilaginoidea virens TaxID=1159556 RepID=A0A8E5HVW9_USTVR|nr:uncharacterized protein UV8b_06795 [Ustilaginoidea virens]QUC22554.1 hypothetical protein UV8b_06795 [Ustilaginoidea virens]
MAARKRSSQVMVDLTDDRSEPRPKRRAMHSTGVNASARRNPSPRSSNQLQAFGVNDDQSSLLTSPRLTNSRIASHEHETMDPTQETNEEVRELYGTFNTKIVGIQYYNGNATAGEEVLCRREPDNQYDRNAIRMDNVMNRQIGHLPRKVVERVAPYIDSGDIFLEAQLTGFKGTYDCPVRLYFYGPSDSSDRSRIENKLKSDKLVKSTELKRTRREAETRRAALGLKAGGLTYGLGTNGYEDPEISLEDILKHSQSVEFRNGKDVIKTLAMDELYLSQMPYCEQPSALKATLLPYQLQGLAWMISKENPILPTKDADNLVQLWKYDGKGYWNVATDFISKSPPKLFSGGILADEMGLGKTLQVISLILSGGVGTTLIVAPVSVMSNWKQQIERHVKPECLPNVLIYHGDKKMSPQDLMKFDVVITSYGKLARERDANVPQVLLSTAMQWRRVVLDEGHTIRNARTKVALAASMIKARSRWVLTGTPIINSVKDLHSLIKFLHITGGIEQAEIFNSRVTRKLSVGDDAAEAILQGLMQDICLRRKKDMKFVDLNLPAKEEYLHRISFHAEEKRYYDSLLAEARGALAEYQAKANNKRGQFQGVLERLLRLRQTCNHWTLCRDRINELMKLFQDQDVVPFNEKNTALLQEALQLYIDNQEDCAICYDSPRGPVITNCKHVFCRACIVKAIEMQHKCPMCRNTLSEDCLLEPAVEGQFDGNFDTETQSSKTEAILQIVRATLKKPGSKVVIFSQWTSFLNIVGRQLDISGLKWCRIDGSMGTEQRDRAVQALDNNADTRVMLASLAVCSVGLNLVSADTVILSDSWWAPAIEDQAVDRVHRLGQTRTTTVWRLIVEGSVEECVLDIQKEKRELVIKTFQDEDKKGKATKDTRMADIAKLLS